MENDTFCGDVMIKLTWRLYGNSIYRENTRRSPNFTNLTIKFSQKYHCPYCLHTVSIQSILVIIFTMLSP